MRKITTLLLWAGLVLVPSSVQAAETGDITQPNWMPDTIGDAITTILTLLGGVIGFILFILLIYGGITYMTAGGNDEQTTKGRKIIFDAIIGLVIVVAAWGLWYWIGGTIGVSTFF